VSLPAVSVIVPVRDGERYLGEALESALNQQPQPLEVIVVDDGSGDASATVAESFGSPVRVLRQPSAGAGPARNRGIAAARGDVIGLLDADDLWTPNALSARLPEFERVPAPDLVWGWVRQFRSPDLDPALANRIRCPEASQPAHLTSGLLATRRAIESVGLFRSDLAVGEFIDWVARARELGQREAIVSELVLWRRLHASNQGVRHREDLGDMARVVKASLDRRRAADLGELG
jgi:glycosyltransferase involved in cell wall biosynthesis